MQYIESIFGNPIDKLPDEVSDEEVLDALDEAIVDRIKPAKKITGPVWWYGGKGILARKIVKLLPKTARIYVEPYCGGASVFWHLPKPFPVEVLNDLDERIVTLFRVMQDKEKGKDLIHRLRWTPYSYSEFAKAVQIVNEWQSDEITLAWAFFVTQTMGFSGVARTPGRWGRAFKSVGGMSMRTSGWRNRIKLLSWWHDRLTRVQIDCRDALEVIAYWDTEDTVFYIDPPYIADTRVDKKVYQHEADKTHHEKLVDLLLQLKGQAVVSGYDHELYRRLEEAGWQREEIETVCSAAARTRETGIQGAGAARKRVPRVEILWIKRKHK